MNDHFGKAIFEISGYKDDLLVGPLKIIRLPSQRSVPRTRKSIEFSSVCPSPKGSIAPSIKDFGIGSEFCKLKVNTKVKSKKKQATVQTSVNRNLKDLLSQTPKYQKYVARGKNKIGEEAKQPETNILGIN